MQRTWQWAAWVAVGMSLVTQAAQADPWRGEHHRQSDAFRFDQRYRHNHYYPSVGYVTPALPMGSISIGFGGDRFFFNSGVWFRAYGSRFSVVLPPIGVSIPMLPPDSATVWIGGSPYYYANGVYYAAVPRQGYVVVEPPSGAESESVRPVPPPVVQAAPPVVVAPPVPKAPPVPVIYPRNEQSAAQQEADKQACNRWATTQPAALADAEVFQRAVAACMDGRGYTVR